MVIGVMATVTDQAICIRQWDFSETSQTVSLFGRDIGLFRALAKGSRRPKSRFSGGVDLLTMGDVVTIIKPGRELCTLTEWGLSQVWWRIRRDVHANRIAYFISDCASRMLDQHDPHPGVFDAMVHSLNELEQGVEQEFILARFLWMLLVDVGYKPRFDGAPDAVEKSETVLFSPSEGGVVGGVSGSGCWRVRCSTIRTLQMIESGSTIHGTDRESSGRASRLLAAYMREVIGNEPPTLSMVFPDLAGGRV
jgi:DNA repair protein RecO